MIRNRLSVAITLVGLLPTFSAFSGVTDNVIMSDDIKRHYRLYVPDSAQSQQLPLVINLHGTGGNPQRQVDLSDFEKLAQQEGFAVVSPLAVFTYEDGGRNTWNVEKIGNDIDDVAFIRNIIDYLASQGIINEHQVYATGFSGGGRMSSRLGCDLTEKIAAIAPVAGLRFPDDCKPSAPLPVLTFHGKKDSVNHYTHQDDSPPYWHSGVEEALAGWVTFNQCSIVPSVTDTTQTEQRYEYTQCRSPARVIFYRSTVSGHTWPGSPAAEKLEEFGLGKSESTPATEIIWSFFKSYKNNTN